MRDLTFVPCVQILCVSLNMRLLLAHVCVSFSFQPQLFSDEEDAYLIVQMHKYGYGNWEAIRAEIKKEPAFNFDWWFKSRNSTELQVILCIDA